MTRVAVVTGAARGIGAATVRGLATRGWAVLAVDRCADDPALPYLLGFPQRAGAGGGRGISGSGRSRRGGTRARR